MRRIPDPDVPARPPETDLDLRARAELALAFQPGEPPPHLLRREPAPWRRRGVMRAAIAAALGAGATGAVLAMRPPALVRAAIEHESKERLLRGNYMDAQSLLRQLGLDGRRQVPGYPQLMRPCDIEGRLVYHLTTFFEKGGMVTVFAFDQPVVLHEASGWWGNVHWQVVTSRQGKPLVLVAQQPRALAVAAGSLARPG
ncbi:MULTISPECIES: hypothetical protein [Ramlibacter]|uniref:DUF3379 domain-containing protein n=1 Tax=Ramlibacter aquaticus TaxID=2780094 RepID=A0ABR9SH43_9BURK|nr:MULTISPECIES: hypothetical protein [Ramlibacter]MBE7941683.1 hypothetical protein [Ramlibacter aquaticus]